MYVDIRKIVIGLVAVAVIQKEHLEKLHLPELNNTSIVNLANLQNQTYKINYSECVTYHRALNMVPH